MIHVNKAALAGTMLILTIVSSCKNEATQVNTTTPIQSYNVLELQPQTASIYTDYPATLQGEEVVEIRPKIEGYLEELYIDEGARVAKGQRLFRISSPQYEQELRSAEAGIKTAEADVSAAEMTVNKTRPLVEKEIISAYELQSAQYTLQSKQAALTQAKATLANARANIGYTIISSPSNGIVGTIPYKKGSLVSGSSTSPLTTVSADKDMYAYFALNEKQWLEFSRSIAGANMQQQLKKLPEVQLVLADGTLYNHSGRIETASGLLTTETGSDNLRATFPNPEILLKSGGSASVRIPQTIDTALLIPQSATYELQDKRLVYVLGSNNKIASKAITVTPTNNGQFFIVTSGVTAGDKVVLDGISGLKDSVEIKPVMVNASTIYSPSAKQ